MTTLATLIGKLILLALKCIGRKGSALPGYVIERIFPGYLAKTLQQLPRGVIIVTGTNGKTTTTKIIAALLEAERLRVLTNPTGSNFVRGIIATIAQKTSWSGRLTYDIAVFEQDEAYAVQFVNQFAPVGVVALNVMRDQMDRFGEIDTTAALIGKAVEKATDWVVLNANDRRIAALAELAPDSQIKWFGHNELLLPEFIDDDQLHSEQALEYFQAAKPTVELLALDGREVSLSVLGNTYSVVTPLDGSHNAINIAAAMATFIAVVPDADINVAVGLLARLQPAFGRGERVTLPNGRKLRLQLVKNPGGFKHSLALINDDTYDAIGIAINDDYADGRDVSWLWDVDFVGLCDHPQIICGGTRAYDMANRLKYEQVAAKTVIPEIEMFLQECMSAENVIIFCTYTAMLKLRVMLKKYDKTLSKDGL